MAGYQWVSRQVASGQPRVSRAHLDDLDIREAQAGGIDAHKDLVGAGIRSRADGHGAIVAQVGQARAVQRPGAMCCR